VIRGIVFDMDGTLVDSQLDFDAMRREMELPAAMPILESVTRLPQPHAERCRTILERHEREGVERATLLVGVGELLAALRSRGVRLAIATRNSRQITVATQAKLGIAVDFALTRDDGPVKPDPWPVQQACQRWKLEPAEVVVVGDYRFDVECGRAAGCRTVLLIHPHDPATYANNEQADLLLTSLAEYPRLLSWLESW
jgi:HAD superfamily hydrolase (TIGR01549 family)